MNNNPVFVKPWNVADENVWAFIDVAMFGTMERQRFLHSFTAMSLHVGCLALTKKLTGKIKRSEERTQLYFVRVQRFVNHRLHLYQTWRIF